VGIDQPGSYRIEIKFFFGKEQDRFTRRLRIRLPQAGSTEVDILVPEKNIEAKLANGVILTQQKTKTGTQLIGHLDGSGRLEMSWYRKLTHKTKKTARLEMHLNTLFTIQEAVVEGMSVFDVKVLEGELMSKC
jgi:hypothetical protein